MSKSLSARRAFLAAPSSASVVKRIVTAQAIWRQRRQLAEMEPRMLRDIGLTEGAAYAESRRGLWDLPSHKRC